MPVIRITAAAPVMYSLDGRSKARFAPGELYQVPDHAARGMIRRGWARDAREESEMVQQSGTAPEKNIEVESAMSGRSDAAELDDSGSEALSNESAEEGDAVSDAFEHTHTQQSSPQETLPSQGALPPQEMVPRHRRKSWKGS